MSEILTTGKFTTIYRDDGKIVVSSKTVYDHIGTHGSPGKGSVLSVLTFLLMVVEFPLIFQVVGTCLSHRLMLQCSLQTPLSALE
jgi:hypothetical protein